MPVVALDHTAKAEAMRFNTKLLDLSFLKRIQELLPIRFGPRFVVLGHFLWIKFSDLSDSQFFSRLIGRLCNLGKFIRDLFIVASATAVDHLVQMTLLLCRLVVRNIVVGATIHQTILVFKLVIQLSAEAVFRLQLSGNILQIDDRLV